MDTTKRAGPNRHDIAEALRQTASGSVHMAGEERYDAARQPWNTTINPSPAIVVEAIAPSDVRAAVRVAGEYGLRVAVQGTGHGADPADGALMINTAGMNTVHVDASRRVARVGAGATWGDVIGQAGRYGLAPLSGSSPTVGVAGYTLGGGHGWLSRTYGFAADSLVRAHIVTSGGQLCTADAENNPELHWALRGGGGNFGVVTDMEVQLYPVSSVYGGMLLFDSMPSTIASYRDWALGQPDEMNTALMMMPIPDVQGVPEPIRGKRVLALRVCYLGDAERAERLLSPLRDAAGPPLMGELTDMSYTYLARDMIDPPPPQSNRGHLAMYQQLPDAAIEALNDAAGQPADTADSPVKVVEIRHFGGAMARPSHHAGPVGGRDASFCVLVSAPLDGLEQPQVNAVDTYMDALAGRLDRHATGGSFLSWLPHPSKIASAYSPDDYQQLQAVKATYDPTNLFGYPNIAPTQES
ncbi:FAD-binding oxidoreductase [Arthrobacter castelli]|uniref:FAD-binding oxidoreductase n=1 Tax=Arthrobacter castelli TaxID=271431 RepID=UPI00042973E2|nr:FAD-binding oxidoreductase [Arthrobacter castelli]